MLLSATLLYDVYATEMSALFLGRDETMILNIMKRRIPAEESCTAIAGILQHTTILVYKKHTNMQVLWIGTVPLIFWLNCLVLSKTPSVVGSSVITL